MAIRDVHRAMASLFRDIFEHRELLQILIARNLTIRYKNSALGFFWTLLGPLFLIAIYALFLAILRFEINLPNLVTGILAWQFHAMCLSDSLHAILGNSNLVTKTSFPRIILPLATVAANVVNFALSLAVLVIYLLWVGADFGALYLLPPVMITHFSLCLGLSLVLSAMNVFFRDTEHMLSVVLLAWFFLTPVIYPLDMIIGHYHPLMHYLFFTNPLAGLITAYRNIFLTEDLIPMSMLVAPIALSWAALGFGVWIFQAVQGRFGDEL